MEIPYTKRIVFDLLKKLLGSFVKLYRVAPPIKLKRIYIAPDPIEQRQAYITYEVRTMIPEDRFDPNIDTFSKQEKATCFARWNGKRNIFKVYSGDVSPYKSPYKKDPGGWE